MTKKSKIKFPVRKTINFNKEEEELFNHVAEQNKPFATYIKELIQEDMNKESLDSKIQNKIEAYFKEYLSKYNLTATTKELEYTQEDRNALLNMMGK